MTWLTRPRAASVGEQSAHRSGILLEPGVDTLLQTLSFDLVLNADKSLLAGGLRLGARERRGTRLMVAEASSLNAEAELLYRMGLDDLVQGQSAVCAGPPVRHSASPTSRPTPSRPTGRPHGWVGFNTGCGPMAAQEDRLADHRGVHCVHRRGDGEPVRLAAPRIPRPIRSSPTGWVMRLSAAPQQLGSRRGQLT